MEKVDDWSYVDYVDWICDNEFWSTVVQYTNDHADLIEDKDTYRLEDSEKGYCMIKGCLILFLTTCLLPCTEHS